MINRKKIASLSSSFLSKHDSNQLRLKETVLLISIPKTLAIKAGITASTPAFDVIVDKEKVSLVTSIGSKQHAPPPLDDQCG